MRKVQKQEVLEMIQTLHQAHDEVKNYIDRKNYVLAQDILSQCQECAISIGTVIEKIEGEGLLRIENSVKNDVPVRKEIAFFSYKASMWDALESVYSVLCVE